MNWLRELYKKILAYCETKYAQWVLVVLSFTESCIFIIPPELLLLPMSLAKRNKAMWYAFITTVASVLGSILGYYIGATLWGELQGPIFEYLPGFEKHFTHVGQLFEKNATEALFLAAFTPIPYKVFTVAAGVYSEQISLGLVIGTAIVGRGARYSLLAGLVALFGETVKEFIEKRFALVTSIVGAIVVIAIYFLKIH